MPGPHQGESKADLPHVKDFVERIGREKNGWGEKGPNGLMYRGHNVFDLYCKKENNEMMLGIIKKDPELACREQCMECAGEPNANPAGRKCWEKNDEGVSGVPLLDISAQECYLGYVPEEDIFLSGWDVFNKPVCGAALMAFRITEDGEFINPRYDYYRDLPEVYDASNVPFYATGVMKRCNRDSSEYKVNGIYHRSEYKVNGIYHCMKSRTRPNFTVIDIRLD